MLVTIFGEHTRDGGHSSEKEDAMEAIIIFVVSAVCAHFCDINFYTLHTVVSIAVAIYRSWIDYTNDKTARR